jgi:hypothetical protein
LLGPAAALAEEVEYVVVRQDHLTRVADEFLIGGASRENLRELARLNKLRNPNLLLPGQIVRLPVERLRTQPGQARVVESYGEARLNGAPVAPGAAVGQGARLTTGTTGGVLVELVDGSRIWVRDGSEVEVQTLEGVPSLGHSSSVFSVIAGRVEALVNKLRGGSRFEVRSPTAKLGVRGTDFRAGADPAADLSTLEVLEGNVAANRATGATREEVRVPGGFGTFVRRDAPPSPPVRLLAPPDLGGLPALVEVPLVQLSFPPLAEAARYRAQVLDPSSKFVVASGVFPGPTLRFPGLDDGNYQVQVRAIDANGIEGRDATHAFRLKARPEPPFPTAPPDKSKSSGQSVSLGWTASAAAERYRIQIATDTTFSAPVLDRTDERGVSYTATLPPGDYYWRLATIDAKSDQGPYGPTRSFVLRPLPAAPDPPVIDKDRVALSWRGEPGQTFELDIARDPAFAEIVRTERVAEPRIALDKLAPGQYYLRVRATDPDGYVGPYTTPQRFDIPAEPMSIWWLLMPLLFLLF